VTRTMGERGPEAGGRTVDQGRKKKMDSVVGLLGGAEGGTGKEKSPQGGPLRLRKTRGKGEGSGGRAGRGGKKAGVRGKGV